MTASDATRGAELVAGGQRIGFGPRWLARLVSGGFGKVLDRIDQGLASGSIQLTLPDGSQRVLGGIAPGFAAQVHLHNWQALLRLGTGGSVGWYQAWEQGEWSSPDIAELFALFSANAVTLGDAARARGPWRWLARRLHGLHRNTRAGAQRNIHAHYDLGNDFYAAWLDPALVYSSAMFEGTDHALAAAQNCKLDAIADRIAGAATVLEIGCGWGALAARLDQAGSAVTAISLSDEQLHWARQHQPARIEFRHQDYRDVSGQFDAIMSVEMVEAVGREYWPDFFDCIVHNLKPGGRAAIQFITMREDLFDVYAAGADFIQTYVFPGGLLIRERDFRQLAAERGLAWTDPVKFGLDYAKTLKIWRKTFDQAEVEGRLPAGFDARFCNLWRYYLAYCEGGFRGGGIDVAQVTLIKPG